MNNIGSPIDRARSLLRAALDPSMTFNPQPIHLKIEDCCSGKPDHFWAHARRKFNDALKAQTGARTGKAQVGFNFIQQLFVLERGWQDLDAAVRHQQRHIDAAPLIAELKDWLDTSLVAVAPKTLTGKALGYLASQWPKLTVFLEDGEIPIHNNLAENKIRPFVIGRKNWLFSDTVAGAHTSAALYSLIETAKANDLDPMIYLHWLFATLPSVAADGVSLPQCIHRRCPTPARLAAAYLIEPKSTPTDPDVREAPPRVHASKLSRIVRKIANFAAQQSQTRDHIQFRDLRVSQNITIRPLRPRSGIV
jgi:hypothetical protein